MSDPRAIGRSPEIRAALLMGTGSSTQYIRLFSCNQHINLIY